MDGNDTERKDEKIKTRSVMYEQQIAHLPHNRTLRELYDFMIANLNPINLAIILHDKDVSQDGSPAQPHIQAFMTFETPRYLTSIAKILGEVDDKGKPKTQQLTKWNNKEANGFAYLTHRTSNAKDKYQYDYDAVISNFDYAEYMETLEKKVLAAKNKTDVNLLLDALYEGTITKAEVENRLTGSQYGRFRKQIEAIEAKRLERLATSWRKEAAEQGKTAKVIWVWGASETGKTSWARDYANRIGTPPFIAGSKRDIFQGYSGEHTIIMDELRPNAIAYSDLLRILDPYSIDNAMAPSRYYDKHLACDTYIITTPYNPYSFYIQCVGMNNRIDSAEQLMRRITVCMKFTQEAIFYSYPVKDERNYYFYVCDEATQRPNQFSKLARQNSTSGVDFFNALFEKGGTVE